MYKVSKLYQCLWPKCSAASLPVQADWRLWV